MWMLAIDMMPASTGRMHTVPPAIARVRRARYILKSPHVRWMHSTPERGRHPPLVGAGLRGPVRFDRVGAALRCAIV